MNGSGVKLRTAELQRSPLSLLDEAGTTYFWKDRVLRAVPPESATTVRKLLGSGLLDALMAKQWIPECGLSGVEIEGSALVVEQKRLPVVTYPYEWTFGMLRAAAVLVLEVNALANEYGWELKDCHGFNIVFEGSAPLFVDLGSFVPRPKGVRDWVAYREFRCAYSYPLEIWSGGGGYIARRLLAASELMRDSDYGLYRWPLTRFDAGRWYGRWAKLRDAWRRLPRMTDDYIRTCYPGVAGRLLSGLKKATWLPGRSVDLRRLSAKTSSLRRRGGAGLWSAYQENAQAFFETHRFRRITEIVGGLRVRSALELGGNQGRLSSRLLELGIVETAICTDADELAVDRGFEREQAVHGRVHTAVLDFVHPMVAPFGEPPARRLQADAVLVLAVAHHLLLTQRVPVDRLLRTVSLYARKFVLIEFMPLGLWDGTRGHPAPPWYTIEWFREVFAAEFELIHEERLEENRHLFCGKMRSEKSWT